MKKISKIFVLLIIWVTFIKLTKACSPIDAPVLVSQNVSGNQLILQWASTTGWACSYNVVVDIQCASGGPNLLTSVSGCVNKPNAGYVQYPTTHIIDISSLCPGETYRFRARECSCGSTTYCGPSTGFFTFTVGGNMSLSATITSTKDTICLGECVTLNASATGGCGNPFTYTWDNGLPPGSQHVVCPTVNTTYNLTATTNGKCGALTTNASITIYVDQPPTVGSITASPNPICIYDSTQLTVNGYQIFNGYLEWWKSNSSNGPWSYIPNSNVNSIQSGLINPDSVFMVKAINKCGRDSTIFTVEVHAQPTADFVADSVCVNTPPTSFTDLSIAYNGDIVNNWQWDFNNGAGTSTQQNPQFNFGTDGSFPVTLIVTTNYGCKDTATKNVIVHPKPSPSFTYSGTMCENFPVTFTNTTPAIPNNTLYWFWDMGDQTPVQTTQNVTHTYANPAYGPFNVKLKVSTNYGCSDSVTVPVYINEVPDPAFTTQNICIYDQAQFNNQTVFNSNPAILYYAWDFGDGNTSTQTSPSHSYNPFGMYTVKLVAYTDSGCADSVTHNIYVSPQPIADFTVVDDCRDVPAQFMDQSTVASPHSIVGWNWDFGVNPPAGSTQQNPSYLYPNNGTFNVTLIVTSDSGCTDTITKPTVRYAVPVANFSFTEVCEYDSAIFASTSTINNPGVITQFIWNFGDGSPLVNIQNPKHKYSQCGPYNVTLIVSSANGCVDDTTRTINIHDQPLADFIADTVCVNGPVTSFTDLSTVQCGDVVNGWQWDFNPGMSNLQNPVHDYNQDGYFPVTLIATSSFGCKDTVTKNIRVYEKPQAAFTADTTAYCHPYCTQFTDISTSASTGIVSWDWDFYNGQTSQSSTPGICFENESAVLPKYYDVKLIVSNGYGCYDTIVKQNFITVWPKPVADFTFGPQPTDIYESEIEFLNHTIGGDTYDWTFGDGGTSTEVNPVHMYADSGKYPVTLYVENQYGCKDTTMRVVVIDPVVAVYIPNAFTPDKDGHNETFFLKGYGIVEEGFQFMIFNRWGEMIYYTEKFEPWDGMVNGEPAPQGVYVYRFIFKDILDRTHDKIGSVTLIR